MGSKGKEGDVQMTQNVLDNNFLTQYSLEKRFAILLSETRKQQEVTLEQLSEGVCTESQLAKIEKAGKKSTDKDCDAITGTVTFDR